MIRGLFDHVLENSEKQDIAFSLKKKPKNTDNIMVNGKNPILQYQILGKHT